MNVIHGTTRTSLGHASRGSCGYVIASRAKEWLPKPRSTTTLQTISIWGAINPSGEACLSTPRLHVISQAALTTGQASQASPVVEGSQAEVVFLGTEGGTFSVKGLLQTTMSPDMVYNILLDYDNSSRIFRNIKESAVEEDEKGQRVLNQRCNWEFFIFGGTFRALFDLNEDVSNRVLEFEMRNKGFMQRLNGRWHVSDMLNGTCQVEYVLTVKPFLLPPPPFSGYTRRIFVAQMMQIMEDLDQEICRKKVNVQSRGSLL